MRKNPKKEAKLDMLKKLKKMMSDDMHSDIGDMKKVTVMSDSEEGLEEGLSKAEEILKKRLKKEDKMELEDDEYSCGGIKKKKK